MRRRKKSYLVGGENKREKRGVKRRDFSFPLRGGRICGGSFCCQGCIFFFVTMALQNFRNEKYLS